MTQKRAEERPTKRKKHSKGRPVTPWINPGETLSDEFVTSIRAARSAADEHQHIVEQARFAENKALAQTLQAQALLVHVEAELARNLQLSSRVRERLAITEAELDASTHRFGRLRSALHGVVDRELGALTKQKA